MNTSKTILLIGDSRLRGYYPRNLENGRRAKVVTQPGASFFDIVNIAKREVNPTVGLVIVVGFFCDLTYLSTLPNGSKKGLSKVRRDVDYSSMVLEVTYWTRRLERENGIHILWTVPYIPDLLKCNISRVYKLNLEPMNERERVECVEGMKFLKVHCNELMSRLMNAAVDVADLRDTDNLEWAIASSRDGLHLEACHQAAIMDKALKRGLEIEKLQCEKPEHVTRDKLLPPNRRMYNRDRRRRNRMKRALKRAALNKALGKSCNERKATFSDSKEVAQKIFDKHGATEVRSFLDPGNP